jgi:demethylmenaquinone methyltransferase/2-methoxy-6-polyprenyl-1,4-benzoquinol methylase
MNIARGRVPKDRVDFVVGDAYALPKSAGKFDAAFAGFWFSHVPKPRRVEFLRGLNSMLKSGAKVVLLDNRFIEGSSSPISEQDVDGNTYQSRKLIDGRTYRVLKNFPSETELKSSIDGLGARPMLTTWDFYWAFTYVAKGSSA